jgi:hypothetical protein
VSDEIEQDWFFTFGADHTHPETGLRLGRNFVRIHGTCDTTREAMFKVFGNRWSHQYISEERAGVEKYGLVEMPMPEAMASDDMPQLDPWQREDGFPSDEYFDAVESAFLAAGIHIDWSSREEDWEYNVKLAEDVYADGPLAWAVHGLFISWRCDQDDEPTHADDFTGLGWYWVPYSKPQTACGDFAKDLALPYLAEPADVAAAVAALVRGAS